MQNVKSGFLALLLATGSMAALTTASFAQVCSCPAGVAAIHAEEPPPPLPVYDQPPMPAPGYMWTPGYWNWNNEDYYWVPGTWVEPPRPGVLWTPGYWGFSNGVYVFNSGYWAPHVGFYGGVAYGFGYGGSGYLGGRWSNGAFFYNQTVNNFGAHNVVNVYNDPVPPNAVASGRVSFNGGAGGTAARPTPEEAAVANEPHEKPTPAQLQNRRAASTNEGNFASTNHGLPAVAATARPGVLTGPDVVHGRPAGEAITPKGAAIPPAAPQPQHALPQPQQMPPKAEHELPQPQHTLPQPGHELPQPQPQHASPQPQHEPPQPQHAAPQPQHAAPQPQHEPPQPQHARPQPQHEAPQPHAVEPPKPQAAAPPKPIQEPKPQVHAPPQGTPPGGHPHCGGPGEPPCR
jgi:hypothetical protein